MCCGAVVCCWVRQCCVVLPGSMLRFRSFCRCSAAVLQGWRCGVALRTVMLSANFVHGSGCGLTVVYLAYWLLSLAAVPWCDCCPDVA